MTGSGRWLAGAAALLLAAGCAQMDPPPGGPEDRTPPYLVARQPDSLAVVPGWNRPVLLEFSERISEQQVEESVMVSPRTSPVLVDRGSRSIRVTLRSGWEPGQIYHVTIRPLIEDLFNNPLQEPQSVVFSTGPPIPDTRLAGLVRDRITGQPEVDARVEAIRVTDSLVYAVPSDSAGRFLFVHVPEGDYRIRAFPDPNRNRELDLFEARDSAHAFIGVADSAEVELSLVMPDSTPPLVVSARVGAERRVDVRFDDYLDPAQPLEPGAATITGPDGAEVSIAAVTVGEPRPEEQDTLQAADPVLPSQLVVLELTEGVELLPETEYTVAVVGIRNVVGLAGDSQEEFTTPAAPEPTPAPEQEPDTVPAPAQEADTVPVPDPVPER